MTGINFSKAYLLKDAKLRRRIILIAILVLIIAGSIIYYLLDQLNTLKATKPPTNPIALSPEAAGYYTLDEASNYCANLSAPAELTNDENTTTIYDDWRLPDTPEVIAFEGTTNNENFIWAGKVCDTLAQHDSLKYSHGKWKSTLIGSWGGGVYNNRCTVRCVRNLTPPHAQAALSNPVALSAESSRTFTFLDAIKYCEDLYSVAEIVRNGKNETIFNDWHLLRTSETPIFKGAFTKDNWIWAITNENSYFDNWVSIKLSSGHWSNGIPQDGSKGTNYVRCTR